MQTVGAPDRTVPMRVIVCGVQRTGTLSMRYALFRLGIHGCYHMHDCFTNASTDGPLWTRALKAKYTGEESFTKEDWDRLLGQYQAACDVPPALFGVELTQMYPEAKVVILTRDPEKWYISVLNSIYSKRSIWNQLALVFCLAFNPDTRAWVRFASAMFKYAWTYDHATEKDKAIEWFRATYDEFYQNIPEERRLQFSVKDGWKPLCDFLELPVPMEEDPTTGKMVEVPFPHMNDRASFHLNAAQMQSTWMGEAVRNAFAFVGKATVLTMMSYSGYLLWTTRLRGRF